MSDEILIRLPQAQVPGFDAAREQLTLAWAGEDAIVLRRSARNVQGPQPALRLFGHTATLWAGDLFHALNLNHATGLAVFQEGAVRRKVFLRNGEIIFAQSNQPDDRLGESLVRAGQITQAQLDEAAAEITPDRKLGKILVDRGWVTARELFDGVRRQVAEIVWGLLDWPARISFFEGFADPDSVIALNLETHRLLVDGIRRTRVWAHVPVSAPEKEIRLQLASNPRNLGLNQDERRMVTLAAGGPSLRQLIDQSGLGVLEVYKLVHHLLEREVVEIGLQTGPVSSARSERAARSELENTIHNFEAIFRDILSLLRQRVPELDMQARLNAFVETLPPELAEVFGAERFDAQGGLSVEQVALAAVHLPQARTRVLKAFNELLYFTLFEVKNHLSDEDTHRIMDIIENMEIF